MARPKAIDKKMPPYKSMDYNALRKEGIALIEKYSGHIWSDFNEHDPGVTILEVLCYVLTELGYKAAFPLEDILYSSPGKTGFNLAENAFYTAREIFPCEPVTTLDFRKLLIDRIEPVNDAWVFLSAEEQYKDLLEVWLLLDDDIMMTEEEVIQQARQVMAAHRNLCQDVATINIMPREECRMEATIFIDNKIDPEKTAAKILFELENTLLNPTLKRYSVKQLMEYEVPPDVIFNGPEMHRGYLSEDKLPDFPKQLDLLKIMNTILDIDGVFHISDLSVIYKGKKYTDHITLDNCLPIFLPKFNDFEGHTLSFYKNETLLPFKAEESVQLYEQLKSQQKRNYAIDTTTDTETRLSHREGRFRNISNYLSLQHEFPNIYGIGSYGLSPDSSKERRAQAKQLKGFLLHFEQLLANSFAQLANLKSLFSIYPVSQTYFHQPLTDVPGLIPLIEDNDTGQASKEEVTLQHYHKWKDSVETESEFLNRRNDFLDHLLARFNVVFNESIYYDFGYFPKRNTVLQKLIKAKEYYLQHMITLSAGRGKGVNYLHAREDVSSFKKRLELLLDIDNNNRKRLSGAARNIEFDFVRILEDDETDENKEFVISREALLADFLTTGTDKNRYSVEPLPESDAYTIFLTLEKEPVILEMGTAENMDEAIKEIDTLCRRILQLSIESEGAYVVEHLMLRPRGKETLPEKDAFCHHSISLVFPSWTSRFQKEGFREQARAIISELIPAHIRVDCFWIDLESMIVFEEAYEMWTEALQKDFAEEVSERAGTLEKLLENYRDNARQE